MPDKIHAKPKRPLTRIPGLGTAQQMKTPRLLEELTNGRVRWQRQPDASTGLQLNLRRHSTFRCNSGNNIGTSLILRVNRLLRLWSIPQFVYHLPVKGMSGFVDVPESPSISCRPTHQNFAGRGRSSEWLCQHPLTICVFNCASVLHQFSRHVKIALRMSIKIGHVDLKQGSRRQSHLL